MPDQSLHPVLPAVAEAHVRIGAHRKNQIRIGSRIDVASALSPIASPEKAPAISLTCRARAVPMPWLAVPSASPLAAQLLTPHRLRTCGPILAPKMPVAMTRTGVRRQTAQALGDAHRDGRGD